MPQATKKLLRSNCSTKGELLSVAQEAGLATLRYLLTLRRSRSYGSWLKQHRAAAKLNRAANAFVPHVIHANSLLRLIAIGWLINSLCVSYS